MFFIDLRDVLGDERGRIIWRGRELRKGYINEYIKWEIKRIYVLFIGMVLRVYIFIYFFVSLINIVSIYYELDIVLGFM